MCIDRSYVGDNVAAMRVDRPYLTSSRERLPFRAMRVVSAVCTWRPAVAAVHATQNLRESLCERPLCTRCRPSALGIQSKQLAVQLPEYASARRTAKNVQVEVHPIGALTPSAMAHLLPTYDVRYSEGAQHQPTLTKSPRAPRRALGST